MTFHDTLIALCFAVCGMIAGAAHFALLQRAVNAIGKPGASGWLVATPLLRFALTGAIFAFAGMHEAPALIAAFAGFLAARAIALRANGSRGCR